MSRLSSRQSQNACQLRTILPNNFDMKLKTLRPYLKKIYSPIFTSMASYTLNLRKILLYVHLTTKVNVETDKLAFLFHEK